MPEILPFPEWLPDISPYQANGTETIQNAFPRADGYGPVPGFSGVTQALAAACRGLFLARLTDGTITVFAGTSTKLYQLSSTDLSWTDVSAGAGTYTALPTNYHWQFAQFGSIVIAVQPNVAPQAFTLGSSSEFAALAGSPPQAAYISVVGRHVVLSGLTSSPFQVRWSALGSAISWTVGTAGADSQDLPDGGIVRGVAGGEYGIIFQESSIRRMISAPGQTPNFVIERISQDKGLHAPYSLVRAGDRIFWLSADGFMTMAPTGFPEYIGKEKFDRTFFETYNSAGLQMIIGAADPTDTRVYWSFPVGGTTTFDRILVYDYFLKRGVPVIQTGEFLGSIGSPGISLEGLDSISSNIDALTTSFDDISAGGLSRLAIANTSHVVGFLSGSNMEATLETSEQALARRMRVRGFRPVTDAASCFGSIGSRETLQATIVYSDEQGVNARGLVPANVSTRLARGRLRVAMGTSWNYATGVEPDAIPEGKR